MPVIGRKAKVSNEMIASLVNASEVPVAVIGKISSQLYPLKCRASAYDTLRRNNP